MSAKRSAGSMLIGLNAQQLTALADNSIYTVSAMVVLPSCCPTAPQTGAELSTVLSTSCARIWLLMMLPTGTASSQLVSVAWTARPARVGVYRLQMHAPACMPSSRSLCVCSAVRLMLTGSKLYPPSIQQPHEAVLMSSPTCAYICRHALKWPRCKI